MKAGETTSGVDAELAPGGAIEGTVTRTGAPVVNAEVCALNSEANATECTLSDGAGDYALERLPVGTYTISFFSESVIQYYNNSHSLEHAQTVPITTEAEVKTGIDNEFGGSGALTGAVVSSETHLPLAGSRSLCEPGRRRRTPGAAV